MPRLVRLREAPVEGQEHVGQGAGGEHVDGLADLALAREEDEHVLARVELGEIVDGGGDVLGEVGALRRAVEDVDGVGAARDLDDRRPTEEGGEAIDLQRGELTMTRDPAARGGGASRSRGGSRG